MMGLKTFFETAQKGAAVLAVVGATLATPAAAADRGESPSGCGGGCENAANDGPKGSPDPTPAEPSPEPTPGPSAQPGEHNDTKTQIVPNVQCFVIPTSTEETGYQLDPVYTWIKNDERTLTQIGNIETRGHIRNTHYVRAVDMGATLFAGGKSLLTGQYKPIVVSLPQTTPYTIPALRAACETAFRGHYGEQTIRGKILGLSTAPKGKLITP